MPPSPKVTITVNQEQYIKLCEAMKLLPIPHIKMTRSITRGLHGQAHLSGHGPELDWIEIFYGLDIQQHDALRFVASEAARTVLHELRHVHQWRTMGAEAFLDAQKVPYHFQQTERDAEQFAAEQVSRWRGLIRVSRKQHGSGFSKLSQHDRRRIV